jgi:gluconate 2-dehydrogenase gamma chain
MVPADELSPKGTDIGINIYIDRTLAGAWGNGDRLYMQGPGRRAPSQGYQLPLTPAQFYRAGITATNAAAARPTATSASTSSPKRSVRRCWSRFQAAASTSTAGCRRASSGPWFIRA